MTKVALVVQRYGQDIVGGAESHARQIAERLHQDLGWQVDVITTTAHDYHSWSNYYDEGESVLNGARIYRFHSLFGRSPLFKAYNSLSRRILTWCQRSKRRAFIRRGCEWVWLFLQGPVNPKMLKFIRRHQSAYERIIFFTYLYLPTIRGVQIAGTKAALVPTAHNEHAFHFSVIQTMLRSVKDILVNSVPEEALVRTKLSDKDHHVVIAGLGFDETTWQPLETETNLKPKRQEPGYILYLGRLSKGKQIHMLVDWICHADDAPLLYLAGKQEADLPLPDHPRLRSLGFVDDETKRRLMANALGIVNPSPNESLSMLVIEAMAMEKPVLVNANSDVLRYYCEEVSTVFGYRNQQEFDAALKKMTRTDWHCDQNRLRLTNSRAWVLKRYSWSRVLETYKALV